MSYRNADSGHLHCVNQLGSLYRVMRHSPHYSTVDVNIAHDSYKISTTDLFRVANSQGQIEAVHDEVAKLISCNELEFKLGMRVHEFVELWAQNDSRKNRIKIDPQLSAHSRRANCRGFGRFLHSPQVRHHLLVEPSALFSQGKGASRPIEQPRFEPPFESGDCPANPEWRHTHQFGRGGERARIDDSSKYADTAREILAGRSHECSPHIRQHAIWRISNQ